MLRSLSTAVRLVELPGHYISIAMLAPLPRYRRKTHSLVVTHGRVQKRARIQARVWRTYDTRTLFFGFPNNRAQGVERLEP